MIPTFTTMSEQIQAGGRKRIAVANAQDKDVLLSIDQAAQLGLAEPLLIGEPQAITDLLQQLDIAHDKYEIIAAPDEVEACHTAIRLIREKKADAVMKGLVSTSIILRAILNKESGIRAGSLLSHIGLFFVEQLGRFLIVTDAAMTISPDLEKKRGILNNAVTAARLLGLEEPKVACVCAVEKVNPDMPATLDAAELVRLNREGDIRNCLVGGPLALDNSLFPEAAKIKKITDPVAGKADILLMPNIEAGNICYKMLAFLCQSSAAGLVLGAGAPVILTSRSDNEATKLNSIILALYLSAGTKQMAIEGEQ
jgi:phosphate butyryltransferase